MPDAHDMDLVREFARDNSEAAFTELVRRHINLVYSVARRCTGNDGDAHDVTQAVFIILARKAAGLREKTLLTGWLYETTRFAAARLLRTNARRHAREQEAYMQSTLNDSSRHGATTTEAAEIWTQLSPHLEAAMSRLAARDRALLVLRFYENKSGPEAAALLGIREDTAHKRVARALEKLRKVFAQRGVALSGAAIAGAVSANSVQAAPVALVKTISVIAVAKGAAATTATLTLVKGTLKFMAWSKTQTVIVVGVVVLLAAGTTTVTIKEIQEHRTYPWQVPQFTNLPMEAPALLAKTPSQVVLLKSKYNYWVQGTPFTEGTGEKMLKDGTIIPLNYGPMSIGIGVTADQVIQTAYSSESIRTIYMAKLPKGRYDFIANLPHDALNVLQGEIKKELGLVGNWEMMDTNVLLLTLANPNTKGFRLAKGFGHSLESLRISLQNIVANNAVPVIDGTGLTNRYDFDFQFPQVNTSSEAGKQAILDALYDQLGLKLVSTNMPIEMLVVEKVK